MLISSNICLGNESIGNKRATFRVLRLRLRSHSNKTLEMWDIDAYLAAASCELVVISMASCTDFCRESLVLWSTGSTDWISMLVM